MDQHYKGNVSHPKDRKHQMGEKVKINITFHPDIEF